VIDALKSKEGELSLLRCTVQVSALKGFPCNPILKELGAAIQSEIAGIGGQLCEMQISLKAAVDVDGVATLKLAPGEKEFQLGPELDEPVERGVMELRLRAAARPDPLHAAVTRALNHTWTAFPNLFSRLAEMEHFAAPKTPAGQSVALG
jgi:hypothetical protein